jgi:hypothetical protein
MGKRIAVGMMVIAITSVPGAKLAHLQSGAPANVSVRALAPAAANAIVARDAHATRVAATAVQGAPSSKANPVGGTTLGSPAPTSGYCATWKRRWYNSSTKKYVYSDHNTPAANGSDQHYGTPENVIVKTGDQGHNDARYALVANDFWVEALGGNSYGSHGYPYPWLGPPNRNGEPTLNSDGAGETGEGGIVQGEVHPSGHTVNFSVWSFSLDDEGDSKTYHDTVNGACVQADGNTESTGDLWLSTHGIVPHP